MTDEVKRKAGFWLKKCQENAPSIFDWFAALCDVCECDAICNDLLHRHKALEDRRADIYAIHGAGLVTALDEEAMTVPTTVARALEQVFRDIAQQTRTLTSADMMLAVAWILLIDQLFAGLGVLLRNDHDYRVVLARNYLLEHKRLTSGRIPWGLVVPKAQSGENGRQLSRLCSALVYIEHSASSDIHYEKMDDIAGTRAIDHLRIGVIAAVQRHDELKWHFFTDAEGLPVYETTLDPASEARIRDRIFGSLNALRGRAHVVILPELITNSTLVQEVAQWLRETRNDGREFPIAVLAGTYLNRDDADPPRNLATILMGDGRTCFSQYKLNPYTLTPQHRAGLTPPLGDDTLSYRENISLSPSRMVIADITGLGRVVVTICEDTARWEPWRPALLKTGPNLCLAPIMNGPGPLWNWVQNDAISIANESGASVIVANSGTMLGAAARTAAEYAFAAFPRVGGVVLRWTLLDTGDLAGDGVPDWWLFEGPERVKAT